MTLNSFSKCFGWLALPIVAATLGFTQEPAAAPSKLLTMLRDKLNPEFVAWSPAYVIERCAEHMATVNESDRPHIRYLDMSDVPRGLLPAAIAGTYFGTNSAAVAPMTMQPQQVPETDNRICWIDLRWYRWTAETWESISAEDPYFREPIVPSDAIGLSYLRGQAGNAVVRASWFLAYTYDTTRFLAKGATRADDAFYYQLLYGSANIIKRKGVDAPGAVPQTAGEFEDFWRVDFKVLKDFPVDLGAIIDEGTSEVAYGNRILWRVRTSLGVYWRTFDVFNSLGDQDFIENPFPTEFDAGEHIFQDERGAQFYMLTDGKGQRVEFGDPRVVHDRTSGARVLLTAGSCIHCHEDGIRQFKNALPAFLSSGAKLKTLTPDRAERISQFYLRDRKLQKALGDDQSGYAEFIRDCNGLTPQENATQFGRIRTWYNSPVTVVQAARELGASVPEFADAISRGKKGRLGLMALEGTPMPRVVWEHTGYPEAGLLLLNHRLQKKNE